MTQSTVADKVAEYLAQGYSQKNVAQIVGIAESTVSEYMKDASFKEKLTALAAKPEYQQSRITRKYDDLEEKTLNSLRKIADNELTDVSDLTRILDSVSRNRAKNFTPVGGVGHPTVGITLIFPSAMVPEVNLDEQNRVIEIGGKSMRPMTMHAVKSLFNEMEQNKHAVEGESQRVNDDSEAHYEQRATA
jgi:predicted transcriptional regulator